MPIYLMTAKTTTREEERFITSAASPDVAIALATDVLREDFGWDDFAIEHATILASPKEERSREGRRLSPALSQLPPRGRTMTRRRALALTGFRASSGRYTTADGRTAITATVAGGTVDAIGRPAIGFLDDDQALALAVELIAAVERRERNTNVKAGIVDREGIGAMLRPRSSAELRPYVERALAAWDDRWAIPHEDEEARAPETTDVVDAAQEVHRLLLRRIIDEAAPVWCFVDDAPHPNTGEYGAGIETGIFSIPAGPERDLLRSLITDADLARARAEADVLAAGQANPITEGDAP